MAASALLILLSPYLLAYFNLVGLSSSREFISGEGIPLPIYPFSTLPLSHYCLVRGVKCEGCLNDVKTRLGALTNVTGVSVQFQRETDSKIADVSISASYPIPQLLLQVKQIKYRKK